MRYMRLIRFLFLGIGFLLVLLLSSCGSSNAALLSNVTPSSATVTVGSNPQPLQVNYDIGQNSHINFYITGPNSTHYDLRQNQIRTPGHYTLDFDGIVTVEQNNLPQQRLLASGTYNYVLEVKPDDGGAATQQKGQIQLVNNVGHPAPLITGLKATPDTISPNFDAIDDDTQLNYQISQPATVTLSISDASGVERILQNEKYEPGQADSVTFDGFDVKNKPLPDGVYTYTVEAADAYGNISQAASTVTIKDSGIPEATITSVSFEPQQVVKGGEITVTITVKNTGKVAIRTQGPNSGYTYDSRDTYRNIDNGQYDYKAGLWRVGVGMGDPSNTTYPYRWGFGSDLQPGQSTTIVGHIVLNESDTKVTLFAGLIQEQVKLASSALDITTINVSS